MARIARKLRDHGGSTPEDAQMSGRLEVRMGNPCWCRNDAVINYLWEPVTGRSGRHPLAEYSRERVSCALDR